MEDLGQRASWAQLQRLLDLQHPTVSHTWLWHMDARTCPESSADYFLGVQRRLGAQIVCGHVQCRCCGDILRFLFVGGGYV
eukprot:6338989-Amphidinium_carterae.1